KVVVGRTIIWLSIAILYLPLLVILVFSFTTSNTMTWSGFSTQLFSNVFTHPEISSALTNTLIIALASAALATLIGTLASVGIFYLKKPLKQIVNAGSQITILNADIVTAIAFMLLFISISNIGIPLPDGYPTLIIAHTVFTIPFVILAVNPKLRRLNPNLYEAGLDLGAGHMRTMWTVIFPQLLTGMITGFAIAFTLSLEDFIVSQYNKGSIETISTLIYSSISRGLDPTFRALSSIVFVTVLVAMLVFNAVSSQRAKLSERLRRALHSVK
ncbi:MAG: ABC transporter permease, partial [Firmicutes bacterium]|nr:ABC transporter permease [Bacillota bacterium]